MQHHQRFDNASLVFQIIFTEIEKYFKSFDKSNESKDIGSPWLRLKTEDRFQLMADKNSEIFKKLVSSIDIVENMSQQVNLGGDSSNYNCDEYEVQLKAIRRIAEYIGANTFKIQIDWLYLLPFDFSSVEPENQLNNSDEIRQVKMDWDQTLFEWAHARGNDYFGKYLKEDAEEGFFVPEKYFHRCHGANDDK